jgi:hypothetical protein
MPITGLRPLRDAGILVKNVSAWHPRLANLPAHHRSAPRPENNAVLDALSRYAYK